jgi:hypothetical protein
MTKIPREKRPQRRSFFRRGRWVLMSRGRGTIMIIRSEEILRAQFRMR